MKGYKGMNADMTCRGKQYEIGKTYTESKAELCKSGMHYCKNLRDVFLFYNRNFGNRFFEVEANEVSTNGIKSVADKLTVVRELEPKEINRAYYYNRGNGDGCYGYSNGDRYGNGVCYGYADRYSNGNGYGNGGGYGDVDGYGYGDGYMNGDGRGNGYGDGRNNMNIQKILIFCD